MESDHPASFFVVDEVVRQAVELLDSRVRPLGQRFDARRATSPKVAWGAPRAVLDAVVGVLVDAIEAAGDSARVQVRVVTGRDVVEVRVSDEGAPRPMTRASGGR